MNIVKMILIFSFIVFSFLSISACDDKKQKNKYQHPSVRNGSR